MYLGTVHSASDPGPKWLPHERLQEFAGRARLCRLPMRRAQLCDGAIRMNTSTAPAICPGACRSSKRRGRIASASPTANAGLRGPMGHKPSSRLSSRRAKRYGEPGAARMAPWCSMRSRRPTNRLPSLVRGRATWRRSRCRTSISLGGDHPDPNYARRRRNMFIVAVNCSHPAQTCFCVSTGDGPRATFGFDIAMSELDNGFVAESGSERGAAILDGLHLPGATREQTATCRRSEPACCRGATQDAAGAKPAGESVCQSGTPQMERRR